MNNDWMNPQGFDFPNGQNAFDGSQDQNMNQQSGFGFAQGPNGADGFSQGGFNQNIQMRESRNQEYQNYGWQQNQPVQNGPVMNNGFSSNGFGQDFYADEQTQLFEDPSGINNWGAQPDMQNGNMGFNPGFNPNPMNADQGFGMNQGFAGQDFGFMPDQGMNPQAVPSCGSWCVTRINTGETFNLPNGPYIIGSSPRSEIMIENNPQISRNHALLRSIDGTLVLEDLHSANGTFIDGMPIKKAVILQDGAVFECSSGEAFQVSCTSMGY